MNDKKEFERLDQTISKLVPSQVFEQLETNVEGLTTEEAEKRLESFGRNTINEAQRRQIFREFLANFTSMMAILYGLAVLLRLLRKCLN